MTIFSMLLRGTKRLLLVYLLVSSTKRCVVFVFLIWLIFYRCLFLQMFGTFNFRKTKTVEEGIKNLKLGNGRTNSVIADLCFLY